MGRLAMPGVLMGLQGGSKLQSLPYDVVLCLQCAQGGWDSPQVQTASLMPSRTTGVRQVQSKQGGHQEDIKCSVRVKNEKKH